MSVKINGTYLGNKSIELVHEPSGAAIRTAAPVDNNGDGSSFSPTDLAASSVAACMVTIMAIVADRDGIDMSGTTFVIEKIMNAEPRRIGKIPVTIRLPGRLTEKERRKLEGAAHACPVHRSLHPDIDITVEFVYA